LPRGKIEEKERREANQVKLREKAPDLAGAASLKCFDDDILLRVSKCCHPVPGDSIIGYVTRGRGVTVHRIDCRNLQSLGNEPERFVDVVWGDYAKVAHSVRISIVAEDKPGQLAEITRVLASCDINITLANIRQGSDQRANFDFFIEVNDLQHLKQLFSEVAKVPGVIKANRVEDNRMAGK